MLALVLLDGCAGHITDTGSPDPLAVSVLAQHSTPVIDAANQIIYFVARSTYGPAGAYAHELHAVNIVSGSDVAGSPVLITASSAGNGDGSVNNVITFDAQKQNQRQALTLVNGTVYVTFSSHCDWGPQPVRGDGE